MAIARIHRVVDNKGKQHIGNNTAKEYIRCLTEYWVPYFGKPTLLRTDPEGAFVSKEFRLFCNDWKVRHAPPPNLRRVQSHRQRTAHSTKLALLKMLAP